MVETQLADEASASPPAPRGQRAGGPHAAEGITTIGQGVAIEGEFKGGEDLVIDGKVDGTIELPQQVLTVGPTGRVEARLSAKSVVVLGKVSGSIAASELVRIGETGSVEGAIAASRFGCGGRCALAGPRGRVGLGPGSPVRRRPACAHFGATMFMCERASLGRPDAAVSCPCASTTARNVWWSSWSRWAAAPVLRDCLKATTGRRGDAVQMRAAVEYLEHLRVR